MTKLEQEIISVIQASILKDKINSVAIFGSYAKGKEDINSDLDLLVEFSEPIGFELLRLERKIQEKTGKKIDLLTPDAISPYLISEIQQTKKTIYER